MPDHGFCEVEQVKPSSVNGLGWEIAGCGLYAIHRDSKGRWRCTRHVDVIFGAPAKWKREWEKIKHEAIDLRFT